MNSSSVALKRYECKLLKMYKNAFASLLIQVTVLRVAAIIAYSLTVAKHHKFLGCVV